MTSPRKIGFPRTMTVIEALLYTVWLVSALLRPVLTLFSAVRPLTALLRPLSDPLPQLTALLRPLPDLLPQSSYRSTQSTAAALRSTVASLRPYGGLRVRKIRWVRDYCSPSAAFCGRSPHYCDRFSLYCGRFPQYCGRFPLYCGRSSSVSDSVCSGVHLWATVHECCTPVLFL